MAVIMETEAVEVEMQVIMGTEVVEVEMQVIMETEVVEVEIVVAMELEPEMDLWTIAFLPACCRREEMDRDRAE